MSEPKIMSLITLSPEFLRDLLQLPEGAEVTGVADQVHARGTVLVRVEGAGWPVEEGHCIPPAKCIVTQRITQDGQKLWPEYKWNFLHPVQQIIDPPKPA